MFWKCAWVKTALLKSAGAKDSVYAFDDKEESKVLGNLLLIYCFWTVCYAVTAAPTLRIKICILYAKWNSNIEWIPLFVPSSLFHSHALGGTRLLSHFADKKAKSNVESFSRITFRCKTYSLDGFALYSLCTWKCILWFIHFWDVCSTISWVMEFLRW